MTRYAAFLRGVNLGKRTVKSAELKAAFEALGLENVKTLLASGNVLFDAKAGKDLQARIEAGLETQVGFAVGTVLRSIDELRAMASADPFDGRTEDVGQKLYVMLFAEPLPKTLALKGVAGDYDVIPGGEREIYLIGYRKPDGTYSAGGLLLIEKQLPKGRLVTTRNWNTILKAIA
ncbi:MAG: DUF1697 domain-containing protein [Devosia nanyangense]|uniref:DUF1697 domain-containing protein n=1 Tax=Devosia nanyangense TaxID=1228055 RepID=A0A933KYE2_9HYPH|nr:DUF1697 domain-containing protein [Devosia nanyangense]